MTKSPDDPRSADAPTLVRHLSETGGAHRLGLVLGQQYELVEVIGEGGIGIVYRARQRTVDRDVAIKVLKKEYANDELAVLRFENEASAIGRLRHPNTLRLYDVQRTDEGDLYIVTELLSGAPLSEVLKKEGRLTPERALRLFDEVCRSLAEAHAAGIVHRDLKPANVFLDHIGREDLVKVLDFGIAKILQASAITRAGVAPGTPHYMAPEQATAQKIDHRADLYALGVILYQMIAGRPPFDGATAMEILKKHITEPVPSFAETAPEILVPAELERFVLWMLEKQPHDRPAGVEVLRKHIPGLLAIAAPVAPVGSEPAFGRLTRPSPMNAPAPNAVLTSRAHPRSDTVLAPSTPTAVSGAANTTVIDAPETSRWRTWSVLTGVLGVLLGVAIGYASLRRDDVIPIATVPETEAIVEGAKPATHTKALVPTRASTATSSTAGR